MKYRSLLLLLVGLVWCLPALAQSTGTVLPAGDSTTDSWATAPLWSTVDDDVDSPDAATISSPNNPGSGNAIVFTVTCPSDIGTITAANLRIRGVKNNNNRTETLAVSWSATAATDFNAVLTTTMANYASGNQTGLSISRATCDGSTITVTPATGGGGGQPTSAQVDAINLDITYTATGSGPCNHTAYASFYCEQSATAGTATSGTTFNAVLSSSATAGNNVIVSALFCADTNCMNSPSSIALTFSDGAADSVTLPTTSCSVQGGTRKLCVGIFANVSATDTFTCTGSTTIWYVSCLATEVSGGDPSSPFDGDVTYNSQSSGSSLSVSYTAGSTDFIYSHMAYAATVTLSAGSGFTLLNSIYSTHGNEARNVSPGSANCTWSWTGDTTHFNSGLCIGMKASGGGGGSSAPPTQMTMGVGD